MPETTVRVSNPVSMVNFINLPVSGIAEHYSPEEVIGRQVCLLANLQPRTLKGIESQGMILMAEDAVTGKLVFLQPADLTKNGSVIS